MDTSMTESKHVLEQSATIKTQLAETISQFRQNLAKADSKAKALLEATAEMTASLRKAFTDYEIDIDQVCNKLK